MTTDSADMWRSRHEADHRDGEGMGVIVWVLFVWLFVVPGALLMWLF